MRHYLAMRMSEWLRYPGCRETEVLPLPEGICVAPGHIEYVGVTQTRKNYSIVEGECPFNNALFLHSLNTY